MRNNTKRTAVALVSGTALATAMTFAGTTGAYAFNDRLKELFGHYFDCKIMLLTNDPDRLEVCGPFKRQTEFNTLAPAGGAPAAAVALPGSTEPAGCPEGTHKPYEGFNITQEGGGEGSECIPDIPECSWTT